MDGARCGALRCGHTRGSRTRSAPWRPSRTARQLHEDGVTYNVYADAGGPARPWTLDAFAERRARAEWEPIARACASGRAC